MNAFQAWVAGLIAGGLNAYGMVVKPQYDGRGNYERFFLVRSGNSVVRVTVSRSSITEWDES